MLLKSTSLLSKLYKNDQVFMKTSPPLYGRFAFPSVEEFLARLKQIAEGFFAPYSFTSYVITYGQGSFYGLDYDELNERMGSFKGYVRTLSSSCSDSENRSVNINIRFNKNSEIGEGQFVIVAQYAFERNQIRDMILGEWVEPTEEELQIFELEKKKDQEEDKKPEKREENPKNEVVEQVVDDDELDGDTQLALTDAFHFNDEVSFESLYHILQTLSVEYLNGNVFSIRMITTDGELYYNIGYSGLRKIFEKRRKLLLKVLLDGASDHGEKIQLSLSFGPSARFHNAEIEIFSAFAQEIRRKLREFLEDAKASLGEQSSMIHEMFSFREEAFSVDRVIWVCREISEKYLDGEPVTAFLSTHSGATFPSLDLNHLLAIFPKHRGDQNFLLFGTNQSISGYTFSLMFQFRSENYDPYGSLSMMWGDDKLHEEIKGEIWNKLNLIPYSGPKQKIVSRHEEEEASVLVKPIFRANEIPVKKGNALVIMPLEAYWSESIWMHIQDTLGAMGFNGKRTGSLYVEKRLEDTWISLNESEIIIADLTYKHPDVFYKIGIAHTLGKPLLLITQHARDLPPDFKHHTHIVYDNNIYGLQRLAERIVEWIKLL
ncbi:MAG: hypothetical protein MRZ79_14245 [Bacteroidia bacterium]|nr:hypothetical protein [Bacteroidia bacterium]